jgi:N-hydroxyarylamine O-acetyltransferase
MSCNVKLIYLIVRQAIILWHRFAKKISAVYNFFSDERGNFIRAIGLETGKKIDFDSYCERISVSRGNLAPNPMSLALLQRQHLLSVPFENLDIHWKRPITLSVERFFEKIVVGKRGGFCYELNGLFNELLKHLGFKTRLVSARVFNGTEHGPEFDHMAVIVTLPDGEYLADVGYGEFTAEPLRFILDEVQHDRTEKFVIRRFENDHLEVAKFDRDDWKSEYIFRDIQRELSEFSDICDFQQYSPESHFRKGKLCSIMTAAGRKTLTDKSFIVTTNGTRHETPVENELQFNEILTREFGIVSVAHT